MAVAYSLFLLGRGTADASDPRPKRRSKQSSRKRLPIRLDLRAKGAVNATHLDSNHPIPDPPQHPHTHPSPYPPDLAHASHLWAGPRHVLVVTTAAMPWMTGTSVNPALRALYLAKDGHHVTLLVPWLSTREEQSKLFARGSPLFDTVDHQRQHILQWANTQVPHVSLKILFYQGAYSESFGSILPVGNITDVIVESGVPRDVCILEEPEHLTWHHSGNIWTELFQYVVGIIHTNYIEYARHFGVFGPQLALGLLFLNVWVCRGYCHRIIKLSDAVQRFPNSVTSNVHGVRDKFIDIGRQRSGPFPRGAYFMGKVLWAKGYRDLIDHMSHHYEDTGEALPIDFYGAGPDAEAVQQEIDTNPGLSAVNFDARVADPASAHLQGYKVFVNASRSDVVCTATAEALAMGKLVVCLEHPSNDFFASFPNCTTYRTTAEFAAAVTDALQREPLPLSKNDAHRLTWDAATERLYDAMRLPLSKSKPSKVDMALAKTHQTLSKIYPQPGKGIRKGLSKEALAEASKSDISSLRST